MASSFHSQLSGMNHELLNVNSSMAAMDSSIFDGVNFEHMIGNDSSQLLPPGMYQHSASIQGSEGLTEIPQPASMSHSQLLDVNMNQAQAAQHQAQQHEQLRQEAHQQQHQQQ